MFELNNFDSIKISIASPEKIREWSRGEVAKGFLDPKRTGNVVVEDTKGCVIKV